MKNSDKVLIIVAAGAASIAAFTAYKTWQVLKQLGDITLDLPNDPVLSSLFKRKDFKEK